LLFLLDDEELSILMFGDDADACIDDADACIDDADACIDDADGCCWFVFVPPLSDDVAGDFPISSAISKGVRTIFFTFSNSDLQLDVTTLTASFAA
jgi:hypothetical protein